MNSGQDEIKSPWERWPEESDRAFGGFMTYLNMQPGNRSVDGAYRLFMGRAEATKKLDGWKAKAQGYFIEWSRRFQWDARARAWDDEIVRQTQQEIINRAADESLKWQRRRQEMIERQWRQAAALADKVDAMLSLPITERKMTEEKEVTDADGTKKVVQYITIKPANWKLHDAARLAERSSILSGRAAQMASLENGDPGLVSGVVRGEMPEPVSAAGVTRQLPPAAREPERRELSEETRLRLARQLVNILMSQYPERSREDILQSASLQSGFPVALLAGAGDVIAVSRDET